MTKQSWYHWYHAYRIYATAAGYVPLPQNSERLFSLFRDYCAFGRLNPHTAFMEIHKRKELLAPSSPGIEL